MKKAIIFGASGFIGSYLLDELLNNADYSEVTIVVRKELPVRHPRLKTLIGDYSSLPDLKSDIVADEIFIALGTTRKKTPDQTVYYQIDHDYPVLATKLAKENGAGSVFLVSAVGANPDSGVFYIRTKGEVERDIIALDLKHTHIFRPSMLLGERKENRPFERFLIRVWPAVDWIFAGKWNKYRGIGGKEVARAMINAAKSASGKVKIYEWKEMKGMVG